MITKERAWRFIFGVWLFVAAVRIALIPTTSQCGIGVCGIQAHVVGFAWWDIILILVGPGAFLIYEALVL